jgi:deazaflavin-dependent oxidoreductase (nitroreductase family)
VVPAPRLRFLRPLTSYLLNPFTRLFAGRVPGFAVLTHVGRTTGRTHRTPVNAFRRDGRHLFVLTYGSDVDWVKNILSSGGCDMRTRGRELRLTDPEVFVDPQLRDLPLIVRVIGRLNRVSELLRMVPLQDLPDTESDASGTG